MKKANIKYTKFVKEWLYESRCGWFPLAECPRPAKVSPSPVDRNCFRQQNQIPLTEFLPQYDRYRRAAPIKRNEQLVAYADCVIAFWDGQSKGTLSSIQYALRAHKELHVYILEPNL